MLGSWVELKLMKWGQRVKSCRNSAPRLGAVRFITIEDSTIARPIPADNLASFSQWARAGGPLLVLSRFDCYALLWPMAMAFLVARVRAIHSFVTVVRSGIWRASASLCGSLLLSCANCAASSPKCSSAVSQTVVTHSVSILCKVCQRRHWLSRKTVHAVHLHLTHCTSPGAQNSLDLIVAMLLLPGSATPATIVQAPQLL
jgi:hypothetical protein